MKKSELRQIIREEIQKLTEARVSGKIQGIVNKVAKKYKLEKNMRAYITGENILSVVVDQERGPGFIVGMTAQERERVFAQAKKALPEIQKLIEKFINAEDAGVDMNSLKSGMAGSMYIVSDDFLK
jgi:flagellar biosynthesis/type III secretory pathway chaperone